MGLSSEFLNTNLSKAMLSSRRGQARANGVVGRKVHVQERILEACPENHSAFAIKTSVWF